LDLHDHPLFEFDPERNALINPRHHPTEGGFPTAAVISWFGDVVRSRQTGLPVVHRVPYEHGAHPIAIVEHERGRVALVNAPVGAPAAVAVIERLAALGAANIIGCGGAGIIRSGFDMGHVIVPTSAVRDEGTSYHYLPAGAEVAPHPEAVAAIETVLTELGVPWEAGRTWTTDGFFRETPAKIARRRDQGCITVEMEASAMFAVAAFRGVRYGQLLYAGDDVSAAEWDHRGWDTNTSVREHLLDLALLAALRMT
jgi:uridine phosphorylase